MDSIIINCDFDGTCVTHAFPNIGKNIGAEFVLEQLLINGHDLILFTMRCDNNNYRCSDGTIQNDGLTQAINWFKEHDIKLYGVQTNPTQLAWTTSPKSYAQKMIDDSAIGCPLLLIPELSSRPFVDWHRVASILEQKELITNQQMVSCYWSIKNYFKDNYNIIIGDHRRTL